MAAGYVRALEPGAAARPVDWVSGACLVAPADVAFGLARMWEILAEGIGWQTQVFREPAAAEAWARAGRPEGRSAA